MTQTRDSTETDLEHAFIPGTSVMAQTCRTYDWSATQLGPISAWPDSLRHAVGMVLTQPFAANLLWGPRFLQVYNDTAMLMMGDRHPAALGNPAQQSWSDIWSFNEPVLRAVRERGESFVFEDKPYRLARRSLAEVGYFTIAYSPVFDEDGRPGGVLMTLVETTARRRAVKQLRQANALIEGITSGTEDLIAAVNHDYQYIFFNEAYRREFRRLWGRDLDLGDNLIDALADWPDQARNARELWSRALGGESFAITMDFGPTEEAREFYDLRFNPITGPDGRLLGAAHILRNVTEHVRTREASAERERVARELAAELAREQRTLAAVIDTLPVGVVLLDAQGRTLSMNQAGLKLHGYRSDAEMVLQREDYPRVFELRTRDGDLIDPSEWPIARALRGERVRGEELCLSNRRRGVERIVSFDIVPVHDDTGALVLLVFVMQDLTAVYAMEAERERLFIAEKAAREAAERSSTVKSQFLSVISHELRTPLTAVLGYADLLQTDVVGPMNERQKEYLGRVKASALHLVSIIDEILTFSRAEAGREEVRLAEGDVAAVTRNVVGMLAGEARGRGLALELDGADVAINAVTDTGKVSQILLNLVGNALKYTETGEVRVTLRADACWVELDVADTGSGIPHDRLEEIFEPFVQVDQSNTRSRGGTGLGLAICRKLARMLGGDVQATRSDGSGSVFTCRLPRYAAQTGAGDP